MLFAFQRLSNFPNQFRFPSVFVVCLHHVNRIRVYLNVFQGALMARREIRGDTENWSETLGGFDSDMRIGLGLGGVART